MALRTGRLAGTAAVGMALALAALAGCGGSGAGGTTGGGSTTGGGTGGTSTATGGLTDAGQNGGTESGGGPPSSSGHAVGQNVQSRGIKGESPTAEAASDAAIGSGDCAQLAADAEGRLGRPISDHPTPSPPLSKCRLQGRGATINIFLDSAFAARQRYMNRMEETAQFGVPDQAKVPHPVEGVGEESGPNTYASWVPAYGSLFAVRGNRWITVAYSVAGQDNTESREEAADLARLAFRLTAH